MKIFGYGLALGLAAGVAAAAPLPDLGPLPPQWQAKPHPGLWQITATTAFAKPPDLSEVEVRRLTPAQRDLYARLRKNPTVPPVTLTTLHCNAGGQADPGLADVARLMSQGLSAYLQQSRICRQTARTLRDHRLTVELQCRLKADQVFTLSSVLTFSSPDEQTLTTAGAYRLATRTLPAVNLTLHRQWVGDDCARCPPEQPFCAQPPAKPGNEHNMER